MLDLTWEEKLHFLVEKDHQMRNLLQEKGILHDTYHPEMEKVHLANSKKLSELIKKMGFPVLSNAGERGVKLSWLIIMHAISSPDFMKECLFQIRIAAGQNDYPLDLLAYLEDRISYLEGRPQLYGTSTDWENGELKRTPIEDLKGVDLRRKSMGLPPLTQMPVESEMDRPPKDPIKKGQEFQKWLVKVGWRIG
jgi:hypothetical protein